jgi:hypothetical protein
LRRRRRSSAVDSDIVCERTLIVDCSWKIVRDSPLAIDEESDMVGSRMQEDIGSPYIRLGGPRGCIKA